MSGSRRKQFRRYGRRRWFRPLPLCEPPASFRAPLIISYPDRAPGSNARVALTGRNCRCNVVRFSNESSDKQGNRVMTHVAGTAMGARLSRRGNVFARPSSGLERPGCHMALELLRGCAMMSKASDWLAQTGPRQWIVSSSFGEAPASLSRARMLNLFGGWRVYTG